ncbi:major facilitator superfamily domain-containing protein [Stachybotrys elegans]|uniref:Major facilitator superfamily domain-containing protein n=1 Tax=Stachybotrys elegans TaxID=80388 RepID=A0A8K0SNM1_9HYPO|nr:major facilitator superfamily domain-containing protein [Stachybotrys elegans]
MDARPSVGDDNDDAQESYFDGALSPDARLPQETTPLLPAAPASAAGPSKSFRRIVVAMCILFLFIAQVSVFLMDPPSQAIAEDIICRGKFPDHTLGVWGMADARCKGPEVQKTLAMVRSWQLATNNLIPVLVQIPFGLLADKYGRRPVLFLSFAGYVLHVAWIMIVLLFPNVFSIWAILFASLAYIIGGGGQMVVAMLYTIVSDVTAPEDRAKNFFVIEAISLILHVAINPITALLIHVNPWVPMWLGFILLLLGELATLLVPETLHLAQAAAETQGGVSAAATDDADDEDAMAKGGPWKKVREESARVWHFIIRSKHVSVLILAYSLVECCNNGFLNNLLQYMAKRYNWDWSTATFMSTFGFIACVVVLLVVLPIASTVLTTHGQRSPLGRDLWLSRASALFIAAGSLLVSVATTPWVLVIALITWSFGSGFSSICRALLMAVVEPHLAATLNTMIGVCEAAISLASSPVMGWLLARGLEIGGAATGLLYVVLFLLTVVATVVVFCFRPPPEFVQEAVE